MYLTHGKVLTQKKLIVRGKHQSLLRANTSACVWYTQPTDLGFRV
jgi:hypothetical protein